MSKLIWLIGLMGASLCVSAQSPDAIEPSVDETAFVASGVLELDTTSISGNRELPKVLAIVPWKKSLPATDPGRPLNSLLTTVIKPVDREELQREAQFHDTMVKRHEASLRETSLKEKEKAASSLEAEAAEGE